MLAGITHGQTDQNAGRPWKKGLSFGLDFPLSKFSETHFLGFSLNAKFIKHYFDIPDSIGNKPLGFFLGTGIDYYLGLKSPIDLFRFKYTGSTFIHVAPGLILRSGSRIHLLLDAGPAINFYSGNTELGFISDFGAYYICGHRYAINPQIGLLKVSRADPLWNISVRGCFFFY